MEESLPNFEIIVRLKHGIYQARAWRQGAPALNKDFLPPVLKTHAETEHEAYAKVMAMVSRAEAKARKHPVPEKAPVVTESDIDPPVGTSPNHQHSIH
jgi:hypothetical protein